MNKNESRKEQRIAAWSEALLEMFAAQAGSRPVVHKEPRTVRDIPRDLTWWRPENEPGFAFGIDSTNAAALARFQSPQEGAEKSPSEHEFFSDMMNRSWGSGGAISNRAAEGAAESWTLQFPGGEALEILVALPEEAAPETSNLGMLLDIELPLTLRFGSTQMAMKDVAGLVAGSVVELDRGIDEPIEILINGHVIARGEAVTVGGAYGVRISEVSSRRERWVTSSFSPQSVLAGRGEQLL